MLVVGGVVVGILFRACHGPTLVGRPGVTLDRADRPGPSIFYMMGRDVKFSEDEPRLSPAQQVFRGWAAARPSPSQFQKFMARPGPSHHFFISLGPVAHGPAHVFVPY